MSVVIVLKFTCEYLDGVCNDDHSINMQNLFGVEKISEGSNNDCELGRYCLEATLPKTSPNIKLYFDSKEQNEKHQVFSNTIVCVMEDSNYKDVIDEVYKKVRIRRILSKFRRRNKCSAKIKMNFIEKIKIYQQGENNELEMGEGAVHFNGTYKNAKLTKYIFTVIVRVVVIIIIVYLFKALFYMDLENGIDQFILSAILTLLGIVSCEFPLNNLTLNSSLDITIEETLDVADELIKRKLDFETNKPKEVLQRSN